MFAGVALTIKIRREQRKKEKLRRYYRRAYDSAKDSDERDRLLGSEMYEVGEFDDNIAGLQWAYLSRQAELLRIPTPRFDEDTWERSRYDGSWRPSDDDLFELREQIEQYQDRRSQRWKSLLTILVGLVGALIGLASVILRFSGD